MKSFLIVGIILLVEFPIVAQYQFQNYKSDAGLAGNDVNCIFQDSRDFIWIGTSNGLSRFDGYEFKNYRKIDGDSTSISDNAILKILEDKHGYLWIGTSNGINRYDPVSNTFKRFFVDPTGKLKFFSVYGILEDANTSNTLWLASSYGLVRFNYENLERKVYAFDKDAHNSINQTTNLSVFQDSTFIWIGLAGYGLDRFDTKTNEFKHFKFNCEDENFNFKINVVRKIEKDAKGNFLLATYGGLVHFDPKHEKSEVFHKQNNTFPSNSIFEIVSITSSKALVATYDAGLLELNLDTFEATSLFNQDSVKSLPLAFRCVFVDRQKNIWAGSGGVGLFKASPSLNRMEGKYYVPGGLINCIFKDKSGEYWIGINKGLAHLSKEFTLLEEWNSSIVGDQYISSIVEDLNGDIWFGTEGSGLGKLNRSTNSVKHFRFSNARKGDHVDPVGTLLHDFVSDIFVDSLGLLWVSTGFGINVVDPKVDQFVPYYENDSLFSLLNVSVVRTIVQLQTREFAIGTTGLRIYNQETQSVLRFNNNQSDSASLSNDRITSLLPEKDRLWVGTESGLNSFIDNRFIRYDERHGLEDINIKRLLLINEQLCVFSESGISIYDRESNRFIFFSELEGFSDFVSRASVISDSNQLLIGGKNGIYRFNPVTVWRNREVPNVFLTRILILNKELPNNSESSFLKEITLTHLQNILTVEFAALNFIQPLRNQYAYKLEGFDQEWIYTGSDKRWATYTNLDPGTYTLHVRASNNDGFWNNEGTKLLIRVLPPPWKSWWAYMIYAVVTVGGLVLAGKNIVQQVRLKGRLKLELFEKEKLKELDEFKSKLFANISHEFRTPLTIILGRVEEQLRNNNNNITEVLASIHRNGTSLLHLVNQMLELSSVDAGKIKVQIHRLEIIHFLKIHIDAFESLAQQKAIQIKVIYPVEEIWVAVDPYLLEKIINNLISNAIKYTPPGGNIFIQSNIIDNSFSFQVRDTGMGIPPESIDRIFDRFYRVSEKSEGTGIGLALSKELVSLLNGDIRVSSEFGTGTVFHVEIPFSEFKDELPLYEEVIVIKPPKQRNQKELYSPESIANENVPLLLIVEDNDELRKFIISNLQQDYEILEAKDGEEGLEMSLQYVPDVVVTDWMMPKLSGNELCSKLKVTEATSHIPIVLLTALAGSESKLEGLETGADDYLTKPFDMRELQIRLKNLIRERNKLRLIYSQTGNQTYKRIKVASADERFINRFFNEVDKQIGNSSLTVEILAKEIGMSRVQLHRKLTALTGHSGSDLVRDYRLQRAADLLRQKSGNVSEIAFQVGFENLSYFSKAFKIKYQQTPSEYQAMVK